jgi:hypothetical protein
MIDVVRGAVNDSLAYALTQVRLDAATEAAAAQPAVGDLSIPKAEAIEAFEHFTAAFDNRERPAFARSQAHEVTLTDVITECVRIAKGIVDARAASAEQAATAAALLPLERLLANVSDDGAFSGETTNDSAPTPRAVVRVLALIRNMTQQIRLLRRHEASVVDVARNQVAVALESARQEQRRLREEVAAQLLAQKEATQRGVTNAFTAIASCQAAVTRRLMGVIRDLAVCDGLEAGAGGRYANTAQSARIAALDLFDELTDKIAQPGALLYAPTATAAVEGSDTAAGTAPDLMRQVILAARRLQDVAFTQARAHSVELQGELATTRRELTSASQAASDLASIMVLERQLATSALSDNNNTDTVRTPAANAQEEELDSTVVILDDNADTTCASRTPTTTREADLHSPEPRPTSADLDDVIARTIERLTAHSLPVNRPLSLTPVGVSACPDVEAAACQTDALVRANKMVFAAVTVSPAATMTDDVIITDPLAVKPKPTHATVGVHVDLDNGIVTELKRDLAEARRASNATDADWNARIIDLSQQLQRCNTELADARTEIVILTARKVELKALVQTCEAERRAIVEEADGLARRGESLTHDMAAMKERWAALEASHADEIGMLKQRSELLTERLRAEELRNSGLHERIADLKLRISPTRRSRSPSLAAISLSMQQPIQQQPQQTSTRAVNTPADVSFGHGGGLNSSKPADRSVHNASSASVTDGATSTAASRWTNLAGSASSPQRPTTFIRATPTASAVHAALESLSATIAAARATNRARAHRASGCRKLRSASRVPLMASYPSPVAPRPSVHPLEG